MKKFEVKVHQVGTLDMDGFAEGLLAELEDWNLPQTATNDLATDTTNRNEKSCKIAGKLARHLGHWKVKLC
jgi:hypothetical protein